MEPTLGRHLTRLRRTLGLSLASIAALTLAVSLFEPPERLRLVQAGSLVWVLVGAAVLNLVTVMPTYRAMLAGPRRVFAVNHDADALLSAHLVAHGVAAARVAGLPLLGLALFLFTGDRLYAWAMAAVATGGCALLWPLESKVVALVAR